jgi:hypothetical protein
MERHISPSSTHAEAYLIGLIDAAARFADDHGLADRNVRLAISLFHARRLITAQQQQALLLRLMRQRVPGDRTAAESAR